ncbi:MULTISPECIES: hypothetical protein [Afipia]|uniref:hypothetical protein n=1 Tax=Afipia TaxID=1033 RepID=UPI0002D4F81D|nr:MULTISPECIES: hypothetical protein [Afipia]
MSALAHYLEEEGIATVAISLIRPQTENTRPPRALWVPFELGRPIGPPSDPVFQKQVIRTALRLLEREDGPGILEDFREEDPRSVADGTWQPPSTDSFAAGRPNARLAELMEEEIRRLAHVHERWIARHNRTTVGLARLPIGQCARYVAGWMTGDARPSPWSDLSAPMMLRFCVDDLKAYCLEAAAGERKPSSKQLRDWFWNSTATGSAIRMLRKVLQASDDERLSRIVSTFMVPAAQIRPGD